MVELNVARHSDMKMIVSTKNYSTAHRVILGNTGVHTELEGVRKV